ncbi:bifunctional DedA family/phosphatase PAP2 family protein [Parendozoicomonas sp. Alg238-R29]|uniref:bifunctional DedA family/phosphatase PAP2 family protein n=1 Tax=Parendozoicomonas sp. Alg238-R29 TaxID=2993446 RepID=UPI00248E0009|nr:bifunctional DedA family/phosphatase PAP2 family protein [Parendozoicomonas sp. Alg238-R29]
MADLNTMAQWLQAHQDWMALTIAVIAFLESLVVVGLLLPGVVMLFTAASLAGGGALDVWTMLLAGFAGAVLGDGVSFVVGQVFHERIRSWWPFRTHPQWLEKGEQFFDRHGGVSIALGRFVGPIRPVIPVVAGMMGMPARYFYLVNILSAIFWAPAYLLPGYFVGASLHWQHHLPLEIIFILAALSFGAVAFSYGLRYLRERAVSQTSLIVKLTLGLLGTFVLVSLWNLSPQADLLNNAVQDWMQLHHTPLLDKAFSAFTLVGCFHVVYPVALLGAYWLLRDSGFKASLIFVGMSFGVEAAVQLLKTVFSDVRPETAIATSFSYPSGHATYGTFLIIWVAWYLSRYLPERYKPWMWSFGLIAALFTGLSRVYLGEHWVADVIAGTLLGSLGFTLWGLLEHRNPFTVKREHIWLRLGQLVCVFWLSVLLLAH